MTDQTIVRTSNDRQLSSPVRLGSTRAEMSATPRTNAGEGSHHEDRSRASPASDAQDGVRPSPADGSFERRLRLTTTIIAPTTVLTALLFYFGYIATAAEYGYFGLSLGTLGFSTQELILRSVAALYAPVLIFCAVTVFAAQIHRVVQRTITARQHSQFLRAVSIGLMVLGVAGISRAAVGILIPDIAREEQIASTPLALGMGIISVAYGRYIQVTSPRVPRPWQAPGGPELATRMGAVGLVLLSLFWATNSFASAYGRGAAMDAVLRIDELPAVVLDTTEVMFVEYPGIEELRLPSLENQRYLYRYRGFRLLVNSNDRLFLIPEQWDKESGAIVVIPSDANVRLQYYQQ